MTPQRRRIFGGGALQPAYLVNDDFRLQGDLAAGSLNSTQAQPTGGARATVETGLASGIALTSAELVLPVKSGGGAATGAASNLSWATPVPRRAGMALLARLQASGNDATVASPVLALCTTTPPSTANAEAMVGFLNGAFGVPGGLGLGGAYSAATYLNLALVARDAGYAVLALQGGVWVLLGVFGTGSTASLVAALLSRSTTVSGKGQWVRVAQLPASLCAPLASDSFTRANGALGVTDGLGTGQASEAGCGAELAWTGATWAISTNKAVNTPTPGVDLATDGAMEQDAGHTSFGSPVSNERSNVQVHGGTYSRHLVSDAANEGFYANFTGIVNAFYRLSAWGYGANAKAFQAQAWMGTSNQVWAIWPGLASWRQFVQILRGQASGVMNTLFMSRDAGAEFYIDDVTVRALTLMDLLALVSTSISEVLAEAAVTLTAGDLGGVSCCFDSSSNPQNGLVGYHDGANAKLEKYVGGTPTTLVNVVTAYSAGTPVRVTKTGTTVTLYYNGAIVGTAQTVSDAGIVSNTLHGLFATDPSVSLDNFNLWDPGRASGRYAALDRYVK